MTFRLVVVLLAITGHFLFLLLIKLAAHVWLRSILVMGRAVITPPSALPGDGSARLAQPVSLCPPRDGA